MRFGSALVLAAGLIWLPQAAQAQSAPAPSSPPPAAAPPPASAPAASTQDKEIDDDFRGFVVGDYHIVGRRPSGGPPYAGSARIERRGETLVLTRKIGETTTVYEGGLERADPPADRPRVFRFRWTQGKSKMLMTCLLRADLDNYARLSCEWADSPQHREPGLEAFFHRKAAATN